jgi:hypothetical protein
MAGSIKPANVLAVQTAATGGNRSRKTANTGPNYWCSNKVGFDSIRQLVPGSTEGKAPG